MNHSIQASEPDGEIKRNWIALCGDVGSAMSKLLKVPGCVIQPLSCRAVCSALRLILQRFGQPLMPSQADGHQFAVGSMPAEIGIASSTVATATVGEVMAVIRTKPRSRWTYCQTMPPA